ncbi:cholesterol oxidase [Jatrophihabitans sp. GAS493]|nr:cholesterol oxidase [Jatrophihabitans sp. GAS493]
MGDYDVLVIGSGFGGSVTALRLTEKGYRVGVIEAGQRFTPHTLPKTSWDLRNFLWAPKLGMRGIQRLHLLKDVVVMAGAGVGGGSLNYANTLYEPPQPFYDDPQWRDITDWRSELAPFYAQARKMLGVTVNPSTTRSDVQMLRLAEQFGKGDTFHMTPVGVFFGRDGQKEPGKRVPDPFFGGAGPERTGCIECGSCMTGCRFGAKNTLNENYLGLAERAGAQVHPLTTVTNVRPLRGGGYAVDTVRTGRWFTRRPDRTFTADHVVFAAGSFGTQTLLHKLKATTLPKISGRLGYLTRTNSEALLGARSSEKAADYTQGVAITSSWHPDENTHIEPVRYGKGSNLMALLNTGLTDGGSRPQRLAALVKQLVTRPKMILALRPRKWSEQVIILLVMQSLNNSITVMRRKSRFGFGGLTSTQGDGEPNPTWIPVANEAARTLAKNIDGEPGGLWSDLLNIPMTAHFIGGCTIGASAADGVIDPYHRVYGYEGLHVVDGSALSANLGVNPSLSITAQAERAMSLWPNAGERDERPPLGSAYTRITPTFPKNPAVPAHAPAALRFDATPNLAIVTPTAAKS